MRDLCAGVVLCAPGVRWESEWMDESQVCVCVCERGASAGVCRGARAFGKAIRWRACEPFWDKKKWVRFLQALSMRRWTEVTATHEACGLLAGRRGCGGGVVDAARLRQDAHAVSRTHCTRVAAAAGGPTAVLIGLATVRLRGVCRVFHTLTVVRVAVLANRSGDALGRSPLAVSVQANVWLYHRWISRRGRRRRETGRGGVSWTIRWRRNGG